jgi:hypothetical protein
MTFTAGMDQFQKSAILYHKNHQDALRHTWVGHIAETASDERFWVEE